LAYQVRRRFEAFADNTQRTQLVPLQHEYFRAEVEASGLGFVGVGTKEAYEDLLANSAKRKDKRALVSYWLSHLKEHYAALQGLCSGRRRAVIVAHPLVRAPQFGVLLFFLFFFLM
jgi:hypothetical protein